MIEMGMLQSSAGAEGEALEDLETSCRRGGGGGLGEGDFRVLDGLCALRRAPASRAPTLVR